MYDNLCKNQENKIAKWYKIWYYFYNKNNGRIISYGGIIMKKVLAVVGIIAWIIGVFTAVVLICLYMKDILKYLGKIKDKLASKCSWFRKAEDIFAE